MPDKTNQIQWLMLVCVSLTTSEDIPDVTLISEKINDYNEYRMTCVVSGNSMDSAIIWNQALSYEFTRDYRTWLSEYVPLRSSKYDCVIGGVKNNCNDEWVNRDGWQIQYSFNSTLPPVTDRRWEEFNIHTDTYSPYSPFFDQVASVGTSNFKIHISLRFKADVNIYLCDDTQPWLANCYWIILEEQGSQKSGIRKCTTEKVAEYGNPNGDCAIFRDSLTSTSFDPPLLSEQEWRHFTVERDGNTISLWKMGRNTPLLKYTDDETIYTPNLFIKNDRSPGYWKLHDYSYTSTTVASTNILGPEIREKDLCISIFVVMCHKCNLKLEIITPSFLKHSEPVIDTVTIKPKKGMEWQEEKLQFLIPDTVEAVLLLFTTTCIGNNCTDQFWAIDDFQICSKNEVRVLSIHSEKNRSSCQVIKYLHWHITQTEVQTNNLPESLCTAGSFGKNCINCSSVLGNNKSNCDNSIICERNVEGQSVCRCASGFTGRDCENAVSEKLKNLHVIYTDTTQLFIRWKAPEGTNEKTYYRIQYKHLKYLACDERKMNTLPIQDSINETSTQANLKNLYPYSEYLIQVIAVTDRNEIESTIKSTTLATDLLEKSELPSISKIEPNSTSVKLILQPPNCETIKGPVVFHIELTCTSNWCLKTVTDHIILLKDLNSLTLPNLQPYCNYTMEMKLGRKLGQRIYGKGIKAQFATTQTAPNAITKFAAYSKTENSISLRFLPPFPPTGMVEQYHLYYCTPRISSIFFFQVCNDEYLPAPKPCELWSNFSCVTLQNLKNSSRYEIMIGVKNVNYTEYTNSTIFTVETIQSKSSSVENLKSEWDKYHNLTLSWNHPSLENGPLNSFLVTIESKRTTCYNKYFSVNERSYKSTYTYTIPLTNCSSQELTIIVVPLNMYTGTRATTTVASPPQTPSLAATPSVKTIKETNITINIPGPKNISTYSYLYVIVSNASSRWNASQKGVVLKLWQNLEIADKSLSWIAAEIRFTNINPSQQMLVIGNGIKTRSKRLNKQFQNRVLDLDTKYIITVIIITEFRRFLRYTWYPINASTFQKQRRTSNALLYILLLLLVLVPLILWIFFKYQNKRRQLQVSVLSMADTRNDLTTYPHELDDHPECEQNIGEYIEVLVEFSKLVKVADFEKYVKEAVEDGELESQHKLVPRGQTKPWDYGLMSENILKNRYTKIIAYDHTRVKLAKIHKDPYSDYINANYIEGYNKEKAYIATHTPKATTINDFWRMIWEQHVYYIVMLENLVKEGTKYQEKPEKYWPNINEYSEFGKIKVKFVSSQVFADYEHRTFLISYNYVTRRVEQLQFKTWPDYDVPLYPQSLVPFLHKISKIPRGISPIVVHCNTGVGRTGAIILCDICLRMAEGEGAIDALKHLRNLREQRVNLLDNIDHYKFVHLVLLEYLVAPQTSIPCDAEMESTIVRLLKSQKITEQMQYLKETSWKDQAMRPKLNLVYNPKWFTKNRFQNITPSDYGRVQLFDTDGLSSYINAVEVDGYRSPKRLIVTQQPLRNTVSDFWRMVIEKEATTIVSLNKVNLQNETSCPFWPTATITEMKPAPFITLRFHNQSNTTHYSVLTIHIYNDKLEKNKQRVIKLIVTKEWSPNQPLPNDEKCLLELREATEKVSRGTNPIVLTCYDGARACGVFAALMFVVEKMKLEHNCDVCLAVKTVRRNRKEFITEVDQFAFLYRAAINYFNDFNIYSTFTTLSKKNANIY